MIKIKRDYFSEALNLVENMDDVEENFNHFYFYYDVKEHKIVNELNKNCFYLGSKSINSNGFNPNKKYTKQELIKSINNISVLFIGDDSSDIIMRESPIYYFNDDMLQIDISDFWLDELMSSYSIFRLKDGVSNSY